MMIERQNSKTFHTQYPYKTNHKAHSLSFYLSVFLIFYAVLYFYIKSFFRDESVAIVQSYFSVLANLILFGLLFLKIFFGSKRVGENIKLYIFLSFIFCAISYCVTFSGLEKVMGLSIILMSLVIFQLYPLKKGELNKIFWLFIAAVVIILVNGTTDLNTTDNGKFNPNTCGFLLAMVFCISLVKFNKTRRGFDLALSLGSFILQFFYISRTAMLGCLLFLILFELLQFIKRQYKFRTILLVLFILPLLSIAAAYLYSEVLYPNIGLGKIFIFGKDIFTGRQEIWHYTFESIKKHFWFGVGNRLNEDLLNDGFYELIINAHNQSLGTLAAFGIFAFVAFGVAFSQVGAFTYKKNFQGSSFTIAPALFLSVICIMSWFDIYFFSQYNWVPILIGYGLICGNSVKEKRSLL